MKFDQADPTDALLKGKSSIKKTRNPLDYFEKLTKRFAAAKSAQKKLGNNSPKKAIAGYKLNSELIQ